MSIQHPIRAACYLRISTILGQTVDNQLTPIREYCRTRGFDLDESRIFSDEGVTGSKERRPALDMLLSQARQGKFNLLVVAGLDRLGRNVKHLLTLFDELNALGIKFISLRESIDLSTPQGVMTMQVLAAVSQLERDLIRQRIRESLAARKLIAQRTGSGWRCGPKTKVTPKVREEVFQLRKSGTSIRQIAKLLGISKTSVLRVTQNLDLGHTDEIALKASQFHKSARGK